MFCRQDITDVLNGENAGIPATFTQSITVGQMDACGIRWPEAHFDPKLMAGLALQTHRMFGSPTAHIPFRVNIEAEAFGCTLTKGTFNTQPAVDRYPFSSDLGLMEIPDDLMSVDDFLSSRPIVNVRRAAEMAHEMDDAFIVSCINGPSALVSGLVGMENALIGMMTEPDLMNEWIDMMEPYAYAYMHDLSEVSDGIMVIDGASTDITPPDFFDGMVANRLRKMFRRKETPVILHSCGNTFDVADKAADLGEDIFSPECSRYPERYVEKVGGRTLLAGCISSITTLLMGTPELIREKCKESKDAGFAFITPECGIAPMTSDENMKALFDW